jgi:hypothetical protein
VIAALYVQTDGAYYGLEGVDPWDKTRDARRYAGPHPVVAHPPCNRWAVPLAFLNQARYGHKVGDDGGCFEAALHAVRTYGGVLEHPRDSHAFKHFGLPRPRRGGWTTSMFDVGMATVVDQWAYGHVCKKETWLYYVGDDPPLMRWGKAPGDLPVVSWLRGAQWYRDNPHRRAVTGAEASATPNEFRDALISMAEQSLVAA